MANSFIIIYYICDQTTEDSFSQHLNSLNRLFVQADVIESIGFLRFA